MAAATTVKITELEARDGMRVLRKGGSDLEPHERSNWPTDYIWWRMVSETGRHFIVELNGEENPQGLFHQIPQGTLIGNTKVAMCHSGFVYDETKRVFAFYKDFRQSPHRLPLLFIFIPE